MVVNAIPKKNRRRVQIVLPQGDLASSLHEGGFCEDIELVDQSPHYIRQYKTLSLVQMRSEAQRQEDVPQRPKGIFMSTFSSSKDHGSIPIQ